MSVGVTAGTWRILLVAAAVITVVSGVWVLNHAGAQAQAVGPVVSLSVGGDHACALTGGGQILCWGRNDQGQAAPPDQLFPRGDPSRAPFAAKALNVGEAYSCAVRWADYQRDIAWNRNPDADGSWSCWGSQLTLTPHPDDDGAAFIPSAYGVSHACGWKYGVSSGWGWSSGSSCIGSNAYRQHDLGGTGIVGGWHTCRLNDDGTAECVGRNDSGQSSVPNSKFLSLDAGREHTCGVTTANRLLCWGKDSLGQSTPPGGSDYLSVHSNGFANFNCALTLERKVRCWGSNRHRQLSVPAAIAAPPPLEFVGGIEWINSRQGSSIAPINLPAATGGTGRLSYNIAHKPLGGDRRKGAPVGMQFNETTRQLSGAPFGDVGWVQIYFSASDVTGLVEETAIHLLINAATPSGLSRAESNPEMGVLTRAAVRRGAWSDDTYRSSDPGTGQSTGVDLYTFRIAAPMEVTIDLISRDADTKMWLWAHDVELDAEPWQDDDGGERTNSRLQLRLPPSRYSLYVTTVEGGNEGAYTLAITGPSLPGAAPPQPDDEGAMQGGDSGRIVARRLSDGRTEFGWLPEGSTARVLPSQRYFPINARVDRWLRSSPIEVNGIEVGRINARLRADGRIEFAFTPSGGERILPPSRYFPVDAAIDVWLCSTEIDVGERLAAPNSPALGHRSRSTHTPHAGRRAWQTRRP